MQMLRFREALVASMVTKQNEEENLQTASGSSVSVFVLFFFFFNNFGQFPRTQEETPSENISYRDMKVQSEQTENDAKCVLNVSTKNILSLRLRNILLQ